MTGVTARRTVGEALVGAAGSRRGIRVVEHDGHVEHTLYAEVLEDALATAAGLLACGLQPGDRVGIVTPEVGQFLRAFFGLSAAGMTPVPLCPPAQAGHLGTFAKQSRHILMASRAAAVLATSDIVPLVDVSGLDAGVRLLTVDALPVSLPLGAPVPTNLDAAALIQFTSGSTAAPKGVVLSHRNLAANVAAIAGPSGLALTDRDIGVSWLPLYHDMGLIGMLLTALYAVRDTIIMSPTLFLRRPTAWLDAISAHRATVSFAPNFGYELCLRRVKASQVEGLDLSSWRVAGCGAEPIRAETLRAFASRFGPAGFRESSFVASYGLAEHCLAVTFGKPGVTIDTVDAERLIRGSEARPPARGDAAVVRLVGCGRALPGHTLAVVDESGRALPERHVGRIVAQGPSVMQGYFNDPVATAATLRDGWLDTGDLGYVASAELFVCGRTKDLIIRQGRKYHPPDIESAIGEVAGVWPSGIVVFGVSRVDRPDEVVAVIEARASVASHDVVALVCRRVRETAGLELDRVVVAPPGTIPRTTSGKVRRAETRERFRAGTLVAGVLSDTQVPRRG